jgi:hypothetical protein
VMGDVAKRPVVRDWTVARSLEEMDDNGIGRRGFIISAWSRCEGAARGSPTPFLWVANG